MAECIEPKYGISRGSSATSTTVTACNVHVYGLEYVHVYPYVYISSS